MSVSRLKHITSIGVDQMGDLADSLDDPEVLRLENLDTNIPPPQSALDFSRDAIADDDANSYLPFFGLESIRKASTKLVGSASGNNYDWKTESLITAGGLSGILNVLLAIIEPGDEVIMTDPTYVGLINRVRLAGGVPRFVPLLPSSSGWHLDQEVLDMIDPGPVTAMLLMSPSMPTGAVFDASDWQTLANFSEQADCWLINDSAMERILFDGREAIHPASFEGMQKRVVTVGSASKEYRMIGWRVGWVVGPANILTDVARVSITNVVCQTGIAMGAVAVAISDKSDGIAESTGELEARRNLIINQLQDFDVIPPHGGWSMLVDVSSLGMDGPSASELLLRKGKIAATPMINWGGERCSNYVRLVYSNESLNRLMDIGDRFRRTFK